MSQFIEQFMLRAVAQCRHARRPFFGALLFVGACHPRLPRIQYDTVRVVQRDTIFANRIDTIRVTGPTDTVRAGWSEVKVFFATDRKRLLADSARVGVFGPDRFRPATNKPLLQFGIASVSIPNTHRPGSIDSPAWYAVWDDGADPARYMTIRQLREIRDSAAAIDTLRAMIGRSTKKEAFVFVHGFHVSFDDALLRTAQLSRDLGFDGAPISYSWPSKNSLVRYSHDADEVEQSTLNLEVLLTEVKRLTGAGRIHVIAHSMGARIAVKSIASMQLSHPDSVLGEVALAAADMKVGDFTRFLPRVKSKARRVTLYASGSDRALRASELFWSGDRAGDLKPSIVRAAGLVSIDASRASTDFLGHGYYGANFSFLTDLMLVLTGTPPDNALRRLLRRGQSEPYWWFIP